MVYRFISKWTSHDIQGIGTLTNSRPFETEDEAIAEKLRGRHDVFEIKAGVFEKIEETKEEEDANLTTIPVKNLPVEDLPIKLKKPRKNVQGIRTAGEVKTEGE